MQHPSHFIAKKNESEANGFARMRAAAAYHGVDMTRQQHVIQPAELTSQVVILPRFDMDLYSATMGRHITQHDAVGIVRDVVRGVAVLGECALAHIDLAPTNVCVHKNGRTWHGVIIDMETVQYVPGRLPALWVDKPPPRLHFASLARHARGDNWTDPAHGSIDIVDELESCGWILCWALCMLQGVAFLSFPRPPDDPTKYLEEAGFGCLHPSEVLARKQKQELHRQLLARETPKGWSAGLASMMSAFFRAVAEIPRRWRNDGSSPLVCQDFALRAHEVDAVLATLITSNEESDCLR